MFPSRRLVRPSSLCARCRRTESRGKAASANSWACRAARCLCEKRRPSFTRLHAVHCVYVPLTSPSVCFRRWSADEARILRVSVNSFLDHLSLVLETMQMFGPPVPQWSRTSDSGLFEPLKFRKKSRLKLWGLKKKKGCLSNWQQFKPVNCSGGFYFNFLCENKRQFLGPERSQRSMKPDVWWWLEFKYLYCSEYLDF